MKKPAADVNVTMSDYQKQLSDIGKLAYLGLKKNNTKTLFSQEEAVKIGGEAILDLGLLHKVSPFSLSCLVNFGHETIQEFLAAVYVCNDETAFSKFWQTMNSLGKVSIFELFIKFVCGLNAQYGQELINKIQYMRDTAKAAQCPEVSYTIEKTNEPGVCEIIFGQRTTALDVTSFLIQCCWETIQSDESFHSSRREEFPYKPVSTLPAIKLKPIINMNIINMYNLTQMIQTSKVVFSVGDEVMLYNLSHNKENEKHLFNLLDHISPNLTNTRCINITNMKSDIQCKSLLGIFYTTYKQGILSVLFGTIYKFLYPKAVMMKNVHLQPSDMQEVLHRLPQDIVELYLNNVTMSGCEASLCEAVTRLISLKELDLKSLSLPGLYQEKLCEAVTGLTQLQKLSLVNTDMCADGEALLTCLTALTLLTSLSLDYTQLTEHMTRAVVELLPSWPDLIYLSLQGLPVGKSVDILRVRLPQLTRLGFLNVSDGGLDTRQMGEVFSSLPQSVQVVYAGRNDTQDDIISIAKKLPSLPNLQYVTLSLHDVSAVITQQLHAAFQQTGAVMITSKDERT